MNRRNVLKLAVLASSFVLVGGMGHADEKDKPGLTGTWVKKAGELKIEFVDENVMKLYPHGDNPVLVIICEYTVAKDGLVKAKITELQAKEEVKEKAKAVVPVGLKFSFTWKAKDGSATLEDTKGDNIDTLKSHLEGEFEEKKVTTGRWPSFCFPATFAAHQPAQLREQSSVLLLLESKATISADSC